jgi:glycosyltransferase involved in cell wall biosynthesis
MIPHSVLLRAHEHARFIGDAIDSLLQQTEPPGEIVVYDDGGTDAILALVRGYGDRVRLVAGDRMARPPRLAEAHALHVAFAASRGGLIFLLDPEDRFKPAKIERYAAAFEYHPDAVLVQAPLERIDAGGAVVGVTVEPRKHVANHLREIYRQQDVNFFYPGSALAFSRYYMERVLPLPVEDGLPLWADTRLCMPAAYHGRIVTLPDPLTERRCAGPPPDPARTELRAHQIQQTFLRARVFNEFCRRHGLRTISPWRSPRFYLQLFRRVLPPRVGTALMRRAPMIRDSLI